MGLVSRICAIEEKLKDLCEDCPVVEQNIDACCNTYNNPLATGYDNWGVRSDYQDLLEEFGFTAGANQMWVRVLEFACDGVQQDLQGKVYGPYAVGVNGTKPFFDELAADLAGTCLQITPTEQEAINNSNVQKVCYDSTKNCTLVLQEGANDIDWFPSVFGFMTYNGTMYDFLDNRYTGTIDGTDPEDSSLQIAEGEDCTKV